MKVPAILKNKYVCYALMALASLNVIGYLTVKAWECLALFTLTAYSCYCYCNNVSCSILAALFVANFVFGCGRVKEGFTDAMAGPVEKTTEAATLLREASDQCSDNTTDEACNAADCAWDEAANACASAAANTTAAVFAASKESCCKDSIWKTIAGDFTQANKDGCSAKATEESKTEAQYCQ
tara:strand:+ start:1208 stop:1753 length:546 start_codon:yes stop_codon:yes gene_type:complete